jgi:diadenosine tetraphosphate (Ap4A) HIT family hydrolase
MTSPFGSCATTKIAPRVQRRRFIDFEQLRRDLGDECFICKLIRGDPDFLHHVFYEDVDAIAFLNKLPILYGHSLVAPRRHLEQVTADFTRPEYEALQGVVYEVGEAIRAVVPTERLYVLSLGSQQGNRHVHWHLVPLPPGVPFEEQQLNALNRADCLELPDSEMAALAEQLRAAMPSS